MKRVIGLALFFLTMITGCSGENKPVTPDNKVEQKIEAEEYLRITTTNKFLYYMVKEIVKDRHYVDYMMLEEDQQWNFKFTNDSIKNIENKDIFIYAGAGFEPWIDEFIDKMNKDKVSVTNSARGVKLLPLTKARKYGDTELKNNPYYWLDPNDYKIALSNIKTAIQEKDPKRRELYEDNFKSALKKIDEIDSVFLKELKKYKDYTYITPNDSLDYFFNHAGIEPIKLLEEEDVSEFEEKLKDKKDTKKQYVLIYEDEAQLMMYKSLIETYGIKKVIMNKYNTDKGNIEMLQDNYNSLKALPVSSTEK